MTGSDQELLDAYAQQSSEEAFAALVERHLNLVYSAALRQVRSPQLAEEIAQSVFTDLARQARDLKPGTILTAWLYQVTRRTAIDVVRRESRRQLREQIALEVADMNTHAADWNRIEPWLDEAMAALDDTDRAAVLLRFFENKSLRDVGASLGTSEDAAQKRISRALDRLRDLLVKRGATVTAAALALALSANAVQAAPAGLHAAILTAATLAGALQGSAAIAVTKTLAMTTLQKGLIAATVAVVIGIGIYETRRPAEHDTAKTATHSTPVSAPANPEAFAALQTQVDELEKRESELTAALVQAQGEKARLLTVREETRRNATALKHEANAVNPIDHSITNRFPTPRHVFTEIGKQIRIASQFVDQVKNGRVTPKEKSQTEMQLLFDMLNLAKASKELGMDKDTPPGAAPEDPIDNNTLLLEGALDLDEQQFSKTYDLLADYHERADNAGLLKENLTTAEEEALAKLNDQARTDLRSLLTAKQLDTFELLSPLMNLYRESGAIIDMPDFPQSSESKPAEKTAPVATSPTP